MNQKINCTVYDCKYCNVEDDRCRLKKIKVACCRGDGEKESAMCDSYAKRNLN